jgi:hypothetical protein
MAELTTIVDVVHGCGALETGHAPRMAKRLIKIRNELVL